MSGRAGTIRRDLMGWLSPATVDEALAHLDALVAEKQQLRDALTFYAERRNLHVEWSGETQIRDRGQVARAALAGTPSEGMVRTEHGWARPCAACGSTDFGKPCTNTEDGFHVAGTPSEDTG